MLKMYQIGKVYTWQNQVGGDEWMNGLETTVTGAKVRYVDVFGAVIEGWPTDMSEQPNCIIIAMPGDLRPRGEPPSGEQIVTELFDNDLVCA
jgi:hypothetical protein